MKIRTYNDADWENLWKLYNQALPVDQLTKDFFMEHLLLSPNFDSSGVKLAEDNYGNLQGAVITQTVKKNISPWVDSVKICKDLGYLMPLFAKDFADSKKLLKEGEEFLKAQNCTRIRATMPGPTLFPDGIDQKSTPQIAKDLENYGFKDVNHHYSMRCDLLNYQIPESVKQHCVELEKKGITARVCEFNDLLKIRRFFESGDLIGRMANLNNKIAKGEMSEIVIAADNSKAFGYCQYNYYGEQERVGPFGVSSEMRGKGIGQAIVAKLLETMAERKYLCAYFVSCSRSNVKFYAKNNFIVFRDKTIYEKNIV